MFKAKTSEYSPLLTNRQVNTPFEFTKWLKTAYFNYRINKLIKNKLRNEKVF